MELIDELMEVKHLNIDDPEFINRVCDYIIKREQNYKFELEESQLLVNFVYRAYGENSKYVAAFGFITNYSLLFIIRLLYEDNIYTAIEEKTYYANNITEKVIAEMGRIMNNHNCFSTDLINLCNKYMEVCKDKVIFASLMPRMTKSSHSN